MKATSKFLSVIAASLLTASTSYASTIPSVITAFDTATTDAVFEVKSKGWRDPAFGNMGWTHSSGWGSFSAKKGQQVTITIVSADAGIHPGATVWLRDTDDTAADNYVVDHFYPQNANFAKFGATDETEGTKLGNIIMTHVAHGYDQDGNGLKYVKYMNGKTDDVAGQLVFNIKAPRTGNYMFVVGGFNPDATVDTALKYNVNVKVEVK
jgi:hypothetical protein